MHIHYDDEILFGRAREEGMCWWLGVRILQNSFPARWLNKD